MGEKFKSLDILRKRVARVQILNLTGESVKFSQLPEYDQLAIDVAQKSLEAVVLVNQTHGVLAEVLARFNLQSGLRLDQVPPGQEIVFWADWFALTSRQWLPRRPNPRIQIVSAGSMSEPNRVVNFLSRGWALTGVKKSKPLNFNHLAWQQLKPQPHSYDYAKSNSTHWLAFRL